MGNRLWHSDTPPSPLSLFAFVHPVARGCFYPPALVNSTPLRDLTRWSQNAFIYTKESKSFSFSSCQQGNNKTLNRRIKGGKWYTNTPPNDVEFQSTHFSISPSLLCSSLVPSSLIPPLFSFSSHTQPLTRLSSRPPPPISNLNGGRQRTFKQIPLPTSSYKRRQEPSRHDCRGRSCWTLPCHSFGQGWYPL